MDQNNNETPSNTSKIDYLKKLQDELESLDKERYPWDDYFETKEKPKPKNSIKRYYQRYHSPRSKPAYWRRKKSKKKPDPPKTTNPHPGKMLLQNYINELGLTMHKLALHIGVPPSRLCSIVYEERSITIDTAIRLGKYFGEDPLDFIKDQAYYDIEMAWLANKTSYDQIKPYDMRRFPSNNDDQLIEISPEEAAALQLDKAAEKKIPAQKTAAAKQKADAKKAEALAKWKSEQLAEALAEQANAQQQDAAAQQPAATAKQA